MSEIPTIAIIMRTRDRAMFLRRAIASVAKQSFRDYELVIVNDGGDPKQVAEIITTEPALTSVKIINNPKSVGRNEATNVGVANSESKYLAILDDDDSWSSEFLAQTVSWLESHPNDGAVATRCAVIHEQFQDNEILELNCHVLNPDVTEVTFSEIVNANWIPPSSMVLHRSHFVELGGWDGSLVAAADWAFILVLLRKTTIGFIDGEPLAFWHLRIGLEGPLGNSVHVEDNSHRRFTQHIRDIHLHQAMAEPASLGLVLYQEKHFRTLENQVSSLASHAQISHQILETLARDQFSTIQELKQQVAGLSLEVAAIRTVLSDAKTRVTKRRLSSRMDGQ